MSAVIQVMMRMEGRNHNKEYVLKSSLHYRYKLNLLPLNQALIKEKTEQREMHQ